MKKIKVLMIVPNLFVANGVASFVMNYLRNVDSKKLHIDFVSYASGESPYYEEIEKAGGKIFYLDNISNMFKHLKRCMQILEEGDYDIIHDNTLHISMPLMWCAERYGVPVRILHSHNSKMGETKIKELRNTIFLPLLRSFSNVYVACSETAGKAMFNKYNYYFLPNVINSKRYKVCKEVREKIRKEFFADSKIIVGTVGRLAEQKNPIFAIDVFKEFLKICPNSEYWWIGNGYMESVVSAHIKKNNLTNNIKLLGSRTDVVDLYQAMDCFFLPSKFEGLPVTGIEAQAMGLPVVASSTITEEMVFTDLVDFVDLNHSSCTWASHLMAAVNTSVKRERYSNCLKQSIFYDIDCGQKLLSLYNEILFNKGN